MEGRTTRDNVKGRSLPIYRGNDTKHYCEPLGYKWSAEFSPTAAQLEYQSALLIKDELANIGKKDHGDWI